MARKRKLDHTNVRREKRRKIKLSTVKIPVNYHRTSCLPITMEKTFVCHVCHKQLSCKSSLKRHKLIEHEIKSEDSHRKKRFTCPLNCGERFFHHFYLMKHLRTVHNIKLLFEDLVFHSKEDFGKWLHTIQDNTCSEYIKDCPTKGLGDGFEKTYLFCKRSFFSGITKGKKSLGYERIKLTRLSCPSKIEVKIKGNSTDDKVFVKFWKTHCGHSYDTDNLRIEENSKNVSEKYKVILCDKIADDPEQPGSCLIDESCEEIDRNNSIAGEVEVGEKFEGKITMGQDISVKEDKVGEKVDIHSNTLPCSPKSVNKETCSKEINLDRPQTPISAFIKVERADEEKEAETVQEICFNGGNFQTEADIHNATLPCSQEFEKKRSKSNEIDLDRPHTPIVAFLKEAKAENFDDEENEIFDQKPVIEHLSRDISGTLMVEVGIDPVISPDRNGGYSSSDTSNDQFGGNGYKSSTPSSTEDLNTSFSCSWKGSSSSSVSLGYDSGSDDLSDNEKKTKLYCMTCKKAFPDKASFNNHYESFHRSSKCSHCNRSFRTEKMLIKHKETLLRCHEFIRSGKLFSNRISSMTSESQSDQNSPKTTLRLVPTHKLMKTTDEDSLADSNAVDRLESSTLSGLPEPSGKNDSNLISNSETSFRPDEPTKVYCKICKSVFTSKSDLKVHFVTHTERKVCKCNHCGKYFKNEKELNTHTENLNVGHVFLKSGQVNYPSFFGETSCHEGASCSQEMVDEDDVKQIIINYEGDISKPVFISSKS